MQEDKEDNEVMEIQETVNQKEIIKYGTNAAKILKAIIDAQPKQVMIGGKQYLQFHDWQTIATFYKKTVGTEWTKEIKSSDSMIIGYEAKANVYNTIGAVVSSAISSCSRDEENWKDKPDFQIRSMAQTRASVKALRNVFAWVVVLAGYEPTPAEEMTEGKVEQKPQNGLKCLGCNKAISSQVAAFSKGKWGKMLCMECQKVVTQQ